MLTGLLSLERSDKSGLVVQLTEQLRELIVSGRLRKDYMLPSSRKLATELGVSRNTVSFAYAQLAEEGYLEVAQGRRAVVTAVIEDRFARGSVTSRTRKALGPALSDWASKLHESEWPPTYEVPPRPFRPGLADAREFPHEIWTRCLRRAAAPRNARDLRLYNRPALQCALQAYLLANRGVQTDAQQIIVLPTAQAALVLIAAMLITPGDLVWNEDPGYGGATAAFASAGARVIGVAIDDHGLQPKAGSPQPKLIFTTPSHHFPTGRLMPVTRRFELLGATAPDRTWIVEDDYDGEFHYEGKPVPALQGLDTHGRVFYVGTFSKAMTAAIRLGYAVVPPGFIATSELAQRHLGLIASAQVQEALAEFIADGHFLAHIRKMRRVYRARRDHLVAELDRKMPGVLCAEVPPGGMQPVARLREGIRDTVAAQRLIQRGVEARSLSSLYVNRPRDSGLFLGFAAWREAEISSAVRTLASTLS